MRRGRRLRAWREGFDLAVEVFRLTGRLDDARTNGFAARMRRSSLRVPALVTRAASRPDREAGGADLRAALDALGEVEAQLAVCRALVYTDAGECARVEARLRSVRRAIEVLARGLLHPTRPERLPAGTPAPP